MNNYILLDGYRYKTIFGSWKTKTSKPATERYTLDGSLDVTYGPASPYEWDGKIIGPVVSDGGSWGTIEQLRVTLAKREALAYQDHYGNAYTVHALGPFEEESRSPMWDAQTNEFLVGVRLVK